MKAVGGLPKTFHRMEDVQNTRSRDEATALSFSIANAGHPLSRPAGRPLRRIALVDFRRQTRKQTRLRLFLVFLSVVGHLCPNSFILRPRPACGLLVAAKLIDEIVQPSA